MRAEWRSEWKRLRANVAAKLKLTSRKASRMLDCPAVAEIDADLIVIGTTVHGRLWWRRRSVRNRTRGA
jgi:hypothetical protein